MATPSPRELHRHVLLHFALPRLRGFAVWTSGDSHVLFLAMRVLISGAGIAGPTLAYWLAHYGWEPTVVETAPSLRTGGYIVDFWGAGFEIADRMGLLPEIRRKGYMIREVRVVGRERKTSCRVSSRSVCPDDGWSLRQPSAGELAASIFGKIEGKVETIFRRQHRSD